MNIQWRSRTWVWSLIGVAVLANGLACNSRPSDARISEASPASSSTPTPHETHKVPIDAPAQSAESGREQADTEQANAAGTPVAVVVDSQHQFGVMDPMQLGEHMFLIRNEGDAPLALEAVTTTCKCTLVEVMDLHVPPGGEGRVRVEWKTSEKEEPLFVQGATVGTNDPKQKRIELRVRGSVRLQLGANPPQLVYPSVSPTERATHETVVYSRVWKSFAIDNFTSSIDGVEWKLTPATSESLEKVNALSGWLLTVTLPANMESGEFKGHARFDVTATDASATDAKPRSYELLVEGRVLRSLAVYGSSVDGQGVVHLGTLNQGQGVKKMLRLKVRDAEPELKITAIETTPEFVKVSVKPHADRAKYPDRYEMTVEVPRDAPPCVHLAPRFGELRLVIDHPRIKELNLKLDFTILRSELSAAR